MKPDIKMIGLDLDGTVFDSEKRITPRVAAALQAASEKGILVLPATGRQLNAVPAIFLDIEGVDYALTSNGACIWHLPSGSLVHTDCFTVDEAMYLLAMCGQFDMLTSVFQDGACLAGSDYYAFMETLDPVLKTYIQLSRNVVPNLEAALRENGKPVEKFSMLFRDEAERQRAWKAFEERGGITITSSMTGNMEINTASANKGAGLVALGARLGIPRASIMAVGDASNDIEMLKAVGYGVAMGNATPDVKAAADAITTSNDEDGVALAIEAIL